MKKIISVLFLLFILTIFISTFTNVPASFLGLEDLSYQAVLHSEAKTSGLLGIETNHSGNPPPATPGRWKVIEEDLLIPGDIWGNAG